MHPLQADLIHSLCPQWDIEVHDELGSTQDELARQARLGCPSPKALLAESQTAGRGRRGQSWHSGMGENLAFSCLLDLSTPPALWPRLTTLAALSLCQSLRAEFDLDVQIKWPNDLWLGGAKLSGLIAEVIPCPQGPRLVLGCGINVNGLSFPASINQQATSLRLHLGAASCPPLDRNRLIAGLLTALPGQLGRASADFTKALEEVRRVSLLLGRRIEAQVHGKTLSGKVLDINDEGHLALQLEAGGSIILSSADSVRPI